MPMKSFWHYFGSKYGSAYRYLGPQHPHVIEPFAGSAGYSTFWQPQQVTLIELDPVVAGIWAYLIKASYKDIMRLPVDIYSLDDVHACQEAKDFIGFQLDLRGVRPTQHRTKTLQRHRELQGKPNTRTYYDDDRFWGAARRARAAQQVTQIKHWRIIHGSYEQAPNVEAHWHIDPPYVKAGKNYKHNTVDHAALAQWCLQRKGFLQVCESSGAQWLPFNGLLRSKELTTGTVPWAHGAMEAALQRGQTRLQFDLQPEGGPSDQPDRARTSGNLRTEALQEERRPAGVPAKVDQRGRQIGRRRLASSE
jgi:hypothetical protein